MTDKEPESPSGEEELLAPSVGEVSDTDEVEPTLVPSGITEERVSELLDEAFTGFKESQTELLEQLAEREVQSKHDSRYGRFETKLDEILAIRDRVEKADGNWDNILAQLQVQEKDDAIAALDAKIEEVRTLQTVAPDAAAQTARLKAQWNAEWKSAVQKVQDRAAEKELSIPADAIEQVRSGEYATKQEAQNALNDLYIAVMTGADIPAAAVQLEGGGVTPPLSDETTPPLDNYDEAMNSLQEIIRTKGAGSAAALEAKAEVDKLLTASYKEHGVDFVPTAVPKR